MLTHCAHREQLKSALNGFLVPLAGVVRYRSGVLTRFQVRRATVDDLPQLRSLWQMENLPVEVLEKRFTEFQVAQNDQGEIVATLGLQMADGEGRLHGEAIGWLDLADELRAHLWPRIETVARNQGLARVWTDLEAPFWKGVGFKKAGPETLARLPALFAQRQSTWLHLPLHAAEQRGDEIEKQLAVLKAMSQAETEQVLERARVLKWIAVGLITAVFAAFAVWVVYFARLRSRLRKVRGQE
jgi:N-acetylglutamate synthase-like GNAT family acetyltransferase